MFKNSYTAIEVSQQSWEGDNLVSRGSEVFATGSIYQRRRTGHSRCARGHAKRIE